MPHLPHSAVYLTLTMTSPASCTVGTGRSSIATFLMSLKITARMVVLLWSLLRLGGGARFILKPRHTRKDGIQPRFVFGRSSPLRIAEGTCSIPAQTSVGAEHNAEQRSPLPSPRIFIFMIQDEDVFIFLLPTQTICLKESCSNQEILRFRVSEVLLTVSPAR